MSFRDFVLHLHTPCFQLLAFVTLCAKLTNPAIIEKPEFGFEFSRMSE